MGQTIYYFMQRWPLDTGHAALKIDKDLYKRAYSSSRGVEIPGVHGVVSEQDLYVSWVNGGSGVKGVGEAPEILDDKRHFGRWNIRKVRMGGLNVAAMVNAWRQIRLKEGAHWTLATKNCASVVRRVLKAGGAERHVWNAVLKCAPASPTAMHDYAKQVRSKTKHFITETVE